MQRTAGIPILAVILLGCVPTGPAAECSAPAIQQAVVGALMQNALAMLPAHFNGTPPSPATLSGEGARLIQTGLLRIKVLTVADMDKDTGDVTCDAEINFHLTDPDSALVKAAAAEEDSAEPRDKMALEILASGSTDRVDARYGVRRDLETNTDRIGPVWDNDQAESVAAFIVAQRLYEQIRRNQFNVTPSATVVVPGAPPSIANDWPDRHLPHRHWNVTAPFASPMVTPTPGLDLDRYQYR